jgi:TrmH family RNA methyltransferase
MPLSQSEKKRLRGLHAKKGRILQGKFLAEGVRLLEESVKFGWFPLAVYCAEAQLSARAREFLDELRKNRINIEAVSSRDIGQISETDSSQGMVALFNMRSYNLEELLAKAGRVLLLDGINDPGNAGTLIRSALAFGFDAVGVTNDTVDPYNSKTVRSSAGAVFGIPVVEIEPEKIAPLKKKGRYFLLTADRRGQDIKDLKSIIRNNRRIMLVIGAEAGGISSEIMAISDASAGISHENKVDSLNAAVAGSILMSAIYCNKKD